MESFFVLLLLCLVYKCNIIWVAINRNLKIRQPETQIRFVTSEVFEQYLFMQYASTIFLLEPRSNKAFAGEMKVNPFLSALDFNIRFL